MTAVVCPQCHDDVCMKLLLNTQGRIDVDHTMIHRCLRLGLLSAMPRDMDVQCGTYVCTQKVAVTRIITAVHTHRDSMQD